MLSQIRNQFQYLCHFLAVHPAGCSVSSFGGIGKVPVTVILAGIAVSHSHDHHQKNDQQQNAGSNTDQAFRNPKGCADTG